MLDPAGIDRGSTRRVEAISDGIFAIAMTLLVVDLRVPAQAPSTSAEALRHEVGPLAAFVVSFVVLAVFWFGHRQQFERIAHADHPLTWMNLAELGFVCLTPFTTSLLGRYPSELPAELAYGANLTAIGLMHWLMWLYGTRPSLLLEPGTDRRMIRQSRVMSAIPAVGYGLATLGALLSPWVALVLFVLVPLPFITGTYYRRLTRRSRPG
jgi:uncharacterized membrane protein